MDLKKLGQELKEIRLKNKKSAEYVSQITGVRIQHIYQIENGTRTVSLDKLNDLFKVFGREIIISVKKIKNIEK